MKIRSVNIGGEILSRLNQMNISKSEFGRLIGIPQQNVNRILERKSIDTEKLIKICSVLKFNFFSLYFDEDRIEEIGKMTISATDHSQAAGRDLHIATEDALMAERVNDLRDQIAILKSQLADKERIIHLMESKSSL